MKYKVVQNYSLNQIIMAMTMMSVLNEITCLGLSWEPYLLSVLSAPS